MTYQHILLPSGVATTPAEVDAYLAAQHGSPETGPVTELAAELNRRNAELPAADGFLAETPVGGAGNGAALYVSSAYDAIGHLRELLFELATPRDYAVYDPQLTWLIDPAGHIPVTVTHGGAGEFPYLTKPLLDEWIPGLADNGSYLIVEREPQTYIQTLSNASADYLLEYRDGGPDGHFGAQLNAPAQVADLIWSWTTGDRAGFDSINWQPVEL